MRVRVPATSANLGPGYDCLGLALDLYDELEGEVIPGGLHVSVEGEGQGEVALDESHLVVRSMRAAFEALAVDPPGLRLRCRNAIPHGRGLGSSSAAIIGGIVLARALVRGGVRSLDDQSALAMANRIEGHPDNVAPALLGGFVVCGQDRSSQQVWAQSVPMAPDMLAVVLIPPTGVATEAARGLLPDVVAHSAAAANTGRAALLVAALGGRTEPAPTLLWRATEDFLHQQARSVAMPASYELVERLRADGLPAVISGAGPTVLCFVKEATAEEVRMRVPEGWEAGQVRIGVPGACVLG